MALLAVMYKTPRDAAPFDKHYFEKHIALAKKIPGLKNTKSAAAPLPRPPVPPTII
jgi:uncharacterized protein (TIGR02118 family)